MSAPPPRDRRKPGPPRRASPAGGDGLAWVWGTHAARAALANPARRIEIALATRNAARDLTSDRVKIEIVAPHAIDAVLPPGAVHQGLAVRCTPPPPTPLEEIAEAGRAGFALAVVLDQVTDPHNVGAVMRSAAAFGARALILQDRKAPPLSGACAKAAVGAAETIAHARVVNISRAIDDLRGAGWAVIGLASDGPELLHDAIAAAAGGPIALVLGAEDEGLRPSVANACASLARIPIGAGMESLNISVAAGVALYEAARGRPR